MPFNDDELSEIESAFEAWNCDWKYKYLILENRMIAIMKNIIRNKGEFKPQEIVPARKPRKTK